MSAFASFLLLVPLFVAQRTFAFGQKWTFEPGTSRLAPTFELMLAVVVVILANRFALLGQIFRSGQVLLYNEALYSGQPVLVIALASVEFAPFFRFSQYGTETFSPFLPRQLPSLRELYNHRESLSLPRLGEYRTPCFAWKKPKLGQLVQIHRGQRSMEPLRGSHPKDQRRPDLSDWRGFPKAQMP